MTTPTLRTIIDLLKEDRVISVLATPAQHLADARSLVLLSQITYWTIKDKNILEAGGWIAKPISGWVNETGLSRNYFTSCLNRLQESALIKVWKESPNGSPWLKLDLSLLGRYCQSGIRDKQISLEQFIKDKEFREKLIGKSLPYFTRLGQTTGDVLYGLFLSRCIFWQDLLDSKNRLSSGKTAWGWSSKDWFADIGITRAQLRSASEKCKALNLIEITEIGRPFPGYWVDPEVLLGSLHSENGAQANIVPCNSMGDSQPQEQTENTGSTESVHVPKSVHTVDVFRNVDKGDLPETGSPENIVSPDSVHVPKFVHTVNIFRNVHNNTDHTENNTSADVDTRIPTLESSALHESEQNFYGNPQQISGSQQTFDESQQSTRARKQGLNGSLDSTTTTSTNSTQQTVVVVEPEGSENHNLAFPENLADFELDNLKLSIANALPERKQALLDEIAGRLAKRGPDSIGNITGYLRTLIEKDNLTGGKLVLEYAHVAKAKRLNNQRHQAALNAAPKGLDTTSIQPTNISHKTERGSEALKQMTTLLRKKRFA